jgi:putative methylase
VDIDSQALQVAKTNASRLGAEDVDFVQGDVRSIELRGIETVLMNPPFGAQWASLGDRAFLRKAMELADVIYTLANLGSEGFIRRFVEPCTIDEVYRIPFPLKRCFEFHSQDVLTIDVELYRIDCSAA